MTTQKPNIIMVVLDTLRPDHLSCYGYPKRTSPNLGQIAAEGALFTRCFSVAPWTLPSHASMFTGTYVSQHGLERGDEKLSQEMTTLAELLQREGYLTAGFSSNIWVSELTGLSRGFEYFRNAKKIPYQDVKKLNLLQKVIKEIYLRYFFKRYDFGAREINTMLTRFFRRVWRRDRPFFLFINYLETHLQYKPPARYQSFFLNGEQRRRAKEINQDAAKFNVGAVSMSDDDLEILAGLYDAEIRYVDARLGELLAILRRLRILDNTLLIVTSDHGENLGDHGLMDHQYSLHDTLIHVPLIVRYPEVFHPGSVIERPVQTVDFLPTVAGLLGLEDGALPDAQMQGKSFLHDVNGEVERDVFAEYLTPRTQVLERVAPQQEWARLGASLRAIRTERFKFIAASDGNDKLYDLKNDPGENDNVLSFFPEIAEKLGQRLSAWVEAIQQTSTRPRFELQEDTRRVLEGLGYI